MDQNPGVSRKAATGPTRYKYRPLTAAALLSLASAGAAMAQSPTLGPLTVVSSGDAFTFCTVDHVSQQPGNNYPSTSIEPNLAINPANPKNILVVVQHDRWSNGGSRGLRANASLNGGKSFTHDNTPNITQCQNGPWPRASDPWAAFAPDGTAYFSSLVTEELTDPNLFGHNGQTVSQSINGGVAWFPPTTLIDTPANPDPKGPQALNDKNSIAADPVNSKYVYVVWDKLTSFTPGYGVNDETGKNDCGHPNCDGTNPVMAGNIAGESKGVMHITRRLRDLARAGTPFGLKLPKAATADAAALAAFPTYVTGPTYFSRTVNNGYTWSAPRIIFDPGSNLQTIGNQITILPTGDMLDFYTQQNDLSGADVIGWVRSTNHGKTWTKGYEALTLVNNGPVVTPNLGQPIRSADILFNMGLDYTNNIIYVTWQDSRFTGASEAVLAFSADGGYSWFGPVRVNQTPRNPANPLFQQALIPSVAAASDGTVVVTYYDFRNDQVGASTDFADYWAVSCNPLTSPDACQSNSDWSNEVRLTRTSFDYNWAPNAGAGHFLGDYMGLKAHGQTLWPAFGIATAPNVTSVMTRSITLPAPIGAVAAR